MAEANTPQILEENEIYNLSYNQCLANNASLTLELEMQGDVIKKVNPEIGMLHRGVEKLIEHKSYIQAIPYFDRMDYISPLSQEYAYILAVEKLLDIKVPEKAKFIRVIFAELERILNHLYNISNLASAMEFEISASLTLSAREKGLAFIERAVGSRMNPNYFLPGGVRRDIDKELLNDIYKFVDEDIETIANKINILLTENRIFKLRTIGVGKISKEDAVEYGLSGVMLRASGVKWDLRKSQPYDIYKNTEFNIVTAEAGDCYARHKIRIGEIIESAKIIKQAINNIPAGKYKIEDGKIVPPIRGDINNSLGAMIHHVKHYTESFHIEEGEVYVSVEAPKGEFGVLLIADGSNKPYRCHIRSAGFAHMQSLNLMAKGNQLDDLPIIINSMDVNLSEIDR